MLDCTSSVEIGNGQSPAPSADLSLRMVYPAASRPVTAPATARFGRRGEELFGTLNPGSQSDWKMMRNVDLKLKFLLATTMLAGVLGVSNHLRMAHASYSQNDSAGERRRSEQRTIEMASGARVEFAKFQSAALKGEAEYSIFLPPSYSKGKESYPVVYFLHGLWNDHTSWTVDRYGHLQEQVDMMIAQKKIPEIIMVHAKGDNSFYTNYLDGSKNYEDYITQDLIQYVEKTYRVRVREPVAVHRRNFDGGVWRSKDRLQTQRTLFGHGSPLPDHFSFRPVSHAGTDQEQ